MRVLICGGGLAGLTLALCLERIGLKVTLVEQARQPRGPGYMIDFFGSGFDACDRLQLLSDLQKLHHPVERFAFVDGRGNECLSLPSRRVRERLFDDHYFNFMRGDFEQLLLDKITGRVELRFGTTVETMEQKGDHVRVRLSDGTKDTFDLLVGADGVHSRIRRLAFGNERGFARFLGCYTAAFVASAPPRALDMTQAFVTVTVPGKLVAVYPIRGGGAAISLVHRADRALDDFSRQAAIRELHTAYGDMGWIVPELLDRASLADGLYFDAVSQIEMSHWSVGRVVLVGDACQCVSPLAGQNASMAVAGAYVLAEELDAAGGRVANAMTQYERRLKPSVEAKQAAGRRFADWFVPDSALQLALRDVGLRMSTWPFASSLARRRLGTESIFRS